MVPEIGRPSGCPFQKLSMIEIQDQFLRRVLHHVDLFEDHIALALHFVRREGRIQDDIRQQVEGKGKMLVQDLGVKSDIFLFGESVQLAADGIDRLGDLGGRTCPRAFEEQMLDEMGNAGVVRRLRNAIRTLTQTPRDTERRCGMTSVATTRPFFISLFWMSMDITAIV